MAETKRVVHGQASWLLASDQVELAVTQTGGQMAPVAFFRGSRDPVQPYYLNPWQGARTDLPLLDVLRGDFFCMPFGAGNAYRGEDHPVHGETANAKWRLVERKAAGGLAALTLRLEVKARPGTVLKTIRLAAGHNAVYLSHELQGFSGRMCFSHHPILDVPDEPGSLRLSVSPFQLGMTAPRAAAANAGNEYYSLAAGARFTALNRVPTVWKEPAHEDCSTFPRRYGFMDLAAVYARSGRFPAWAAAVLPARGYLWYALKDPAVLPQLLVWMDNGGRHAPPWNGSNRCLGVEDGCTFFGEGLAASAKANLLTRQGIPTSVSLSPRRPTVIRHIQGAVRVPAGFDRVRSVAFTPGGATFFAASGKQVSTPVDWEFLRSGALAVSAMPKRR
jgi:hypothetical protein